MSTHIRRPSLLSVPDSNSRRDSFKEPQVILIKAHQQRGSKICSRILRSVEKRDQYNTALLLSQRLKMKAFNMNTSFLYEDERSLTESQLKRQVRMAKRLLSPKEKQTVVSRLFSPNHKVQTPLSQTEKEQIFEMAGKIKQNLGHKTTYSHRTQLRLDSAVKESQCLPPPKLTQLEYQLQKALQRYSPKMQIEKHKYQSLQFHIDQQTFDPSVIHSTERPITANAQTTNEKVVSTKKLAISGVPEVPRGDWDRFRILNRYI